MGAELSKGMLDMKKESVALLEGLYNAKYYRKWQFLPMCDLFTEELRGSLPYHTSHIPHLERQV